MNHRLNLLQIIQDAPISRGDLSKCYTALSYAVQHRWLSGMISDGMIRRVKFGVYEAIV